MIFAAWSLPARLVAGALVVGLAGAAGFALGARLKQGQWDAERVQQRDAALEAERLATRNISRIADDTHTRLARARADADAARAAGDRLRDAAASAAARCAAPAAPGEAAEPAGVVLADVLGRADARAGELAAALDAAHAAGVGCERAYEALTGP